MPRKPHVEQIKELTIEEIAALQLWEVLDLAIPHGKRERVAGNIKEKYRTLSSWCQDPQANSKWHKASGRRGMPHDHVSFVLAIHAICPEGAAFYLRWLECQIAEADAIQGRDKLKAALKVADEARALAERIIEITGGPSRNKT